ncbi:CLAVATA3/ESR-RELATED 45 [Hibiscus trionum]|uniref:CLAVATA3/ESR-RELATED 45 n=1 Tax=Hibiscus trionum TaxID=183268 RepID=A0A9W7J1C2_HIBTR|nr:CLAVATA3/ESR-RELATED 45 [Hibiscus trionum]
MVCSAQRVVIFLMVFGLLAVQPVEVSGLRNMDLVVFRHSQRVLKAVDTKGMDTEKKPAFVNNGFDPNRSSKRRVRRGSDPIHNRS